jgi:hypothetical protein
MGRVYSLFEITGLTHEPGSCRFWEGSMALRDVGKAGMDGVRGVYIGW